jgi:hypothetical protein
VDLPLEVLVLLDLLYLLGLLLLVPHQVFLIIVLGYHHHDKVRMRSTDVPSCNV